MANYVRISVMKHADSHAPYPSLEDYKEMDLETRVQKMLRYLEGQIEQV